LHPGWECKESTKRRLEKMQLERAEFPESPEFQRIPEIENEMNPKGEVEMEQPWEELDIVEASPERAPTERAPTEQAPTERAPTEQAPTAENAERTAEEAES
jgi:hypothetical protein